MLNKANEVQGEPITILDSDTPVQSAPPRALGKVRLSVQDHARLGDLFQAGALKCVFPRPRTASRLDAVLVNTAGGVTGGDRFTTTAHIKSGARLAVTTQAAERFYRAMPGETAQITTRLIVDEGAELAWLPQESICFDGCSIRRRLDLTIAPTGQALVVEPLVFGRMAFGETVVNGSISDRIFVRRNERPLYMDAWRLEGDLTAHLDRPAIGAGARAMASLIYIAPDASAQLSKIRDMLPEKAGISALGDDILAMRLLAASGYEMRGTLLPVLDLLTHQTLPLCWRL